MPKVLPLVEKGSNYFFHVLAVAKINYDSEYAVNYKDSLLDTDRIFLQENKSLLSFGDGTPPSIYTVLAFFISSIINLSSQDEIDEYFNLVADFVNNKDFAVFCHRYGEALEKIDMLHAGYSEYLKGETVKLNKDQSELVLELGELLKGNYKVYEERVWPVEYPNLKEKSTELYNALKDKVIFQSWDELVGDNYKTNSFQVSLCVANNKGPDANDLGYDKNLHYYKRPTEDLIYFVSHEIGIRYLMPSVNKVRGELHQAGQNVLYDALESLAEFYNLRVLGSGHRGFFPNLSFIEVFEEIYEKKPDHSAAELLKAAILKTH